MTTSVLEADVEFGSALAIIWQRHRQTNLNRVSLLEMTAANVLRSKADAACIAEGISAAHMLAGSLGTFGFDSGSRAALEAESLLREPVVDGLLLAETVLALRVSVEEVGDAREPELIPTVSSAAIRTAPSAVRVVSCDADLVSRLTVEAASIGLVATTTTKLPAPVTPRKDLTRLVIFDAAGPWTQSEMVKSLTALARGVAIIVLTDRDSWQQRVEFARLGVTGVIPRSMGARQMLSFVGESIERRDVATSTLLALNITPELVDPLREATAGINCNLEILDNPPALWMALEDRGADLLILGITGLVTGPEVCRVIRAHPRWHRLPVVVIGDHNLVHLDRVFGAGADDWLNVRVAPRDLGVRLCAHIERGRVNHTRSDIDPFTGTENRASAERSLEQLLSVASNRDDPVAIALVTVDQFDQARESGGNAMGDVVLRRLGTRLQACLRGEDVIGRWTHDGFMVGLYGNVSKSAIERLAQVSNTFGAEVFSATSGKPARYTISAGVSSTPSDGSRLSTLVRLSESALLRAKAGKNRMVIAGDRPLTEAQLVVDVVLVEDDDTVADVIEHALVQRDYTFFRFSDGAEAAQALGGGAVKGRVILLDVGLPSLDGFGVLHALRGQSALEGTRVIMLTARSSESEMLRALGLGATEHITKPFSVPLLLGRLSPTLDGPI
jgi:diguanylate cyclase (GGDEF)-like protein